MLRRFSRIDETGRWFFPESFTSNGKRLLGLAISAGPFSPGSDRRIAVYDMEKEAYEIIERDLLKPPFSVGWAPDERRIMIWNSDGIYVYDPAKDDLKTVMEIDVDPSEFVRFQVTSNGYLYYAVPEDERDIWIARLGMPGQLTKFGEDDF